jgi:hypothetical protein
MDLVHFFRWSVGVHQTAAVAENALSSALPGYVRFQFIQQPRRARDDQPPGNCRRVALRNEFPDAPGTPEPGFPFLLVTFDGRLWLFPSGTEPIPCEGTQTIPTPLPVDQGRSVLEHETI